MRAQFHFQLSSVIFPILAKCNEDFWKKKIQIWKFVQGSIQYRNYLYLSIRQIVKF